MNEIALSDDLNVITAEINSYKQVAGNSFVEIGKRLIHVKENNLTHGDWQPFLKQINMSKSQADRFMKVAKEHQIGKLPDVGNIGFQAMYEIATLPAEHREKAINDDGSAKAIREIREVKQQLKRERAAREQAERTAEITQRKLEQAENRKPETKTIEKEVIPDRVQKQLEFAKKENQRLRQENDTYKMKDTSSFDEEQAEREMKRLQSEADRTTVEIRAAFKRLNDKVSVSRYINEAIAASGDYEKKKMQEEITITENILHDIKTALKGRKEVNAL